MSAHLLSWAFWSLTWAWFFSFFFLSFFFFCLVFSYLALCESVGKVSVGDLSSMKLGPGPGTAECKSLWNDMMNEIADNGFRGWYSSRDAQWPATACAWAPLKSELDTEIRTKLHVCGQWFKAVHCLQTARNAFTFGFIFTLIDSCRAS